jgi:alpha-beta hydrolase superfamily lysophospholipase
VNQANPRALVFPGRGETVHDLRPLVASQDITGIDFDDRFAALGFAAQLAAVERLLAADGSSTTLLVGRSFGAWLLLHALLDRSAAYPGTVLLIAPVLGAGSAGKTGFIPPRARTFWQRLEAGHPMPASKMVLACSTTDTQAPIDLARALARHWRIELHECDIGHDLPSWTAVETSRHVQSLLRTTQSEATTC